MLETILGNIWNLFLIVLTITAIIFLVTLIINFIGATIDNMKQRKMKNEALKSVQEALEMKVAAMQTKCDITEPEKVKKPRKKVDKDNKE